jgi:TolB-like protein/DNA-binding winged helix-turn-helix (wHTH) protein/Tfp pilus assembly protein PilF
VQFRPKYYLGPFVVDSEKYLITKEEESIHLPELPFQVLLHLIQNRERYVSRQELLDRFWQGNEVYEETLTKCISTIRTQLGDPPSAPLYIETRKKVGYRYIGPYEVFTAAPELAVGTEVERIREVSIIVEEDEQEEFPANNSPALPPYRKSSVRNIVLLTFVASLVIAGSFVYYRRNASAGHPEEVRFNSIAVLPLRNLTGNQNEDYFSDGITESLITSLSRIPGLSVQSRSSVFRFKNKDIDLQSVGNQLGVTAVLEGTVRKLDQSVRVSVRLVNVRDGKVIWVSNSEERSLGDLFALQDEIARNVASGLKLKLTGESERLMARRYTENVEAYQLYLQGRYFLNNWASDNDLLKGIKYFEAAIAKDSNYALAYTGIADAYIMMAIDWADPNDVMPKAQRYAERALSLDGSLGEAHYSSGALAYFYEWDWKKANQELDRALELDAKSIEANACYLHSLESWEEPDRAMAMMRRVLDRNPLSLGVTAELGCAAYYAGRFEQSIEFGRQMNQMEPGNGLAHYNLARSLGQTRRYTEALQELEKTESIWGRLPSVLAERGFVYAAMGNSAEARKILAELRSRSSKEFIDPYPVAFIFVGLGEKDEALTTLERGYELRSAWMPWIRVEPKFQSLQSEPRFLTLLHKLKLDSSS